ncbi:LacI family DNA-binding transcriptional regulator [Luedemannella helvata]
MRDVAKAAGVSSQTVSKVVRGLPGVSTDTRTRIMGIMRDLGFQPNVWARALKTGHASSIGVICDELPRPGPSLVIYGVESAARQAGYYSTVAGLPRPTPDLLQQAVEQLLSLSVAGIVVNVAMSSETGVLDQLRSDVPLVAVWAPTDTRLPVATYDHRSAAARATRHLLEMGHTTVHHLAGMHNQFGTDQRVAGWREALTQAGAPVPDVLYGNWDSRSGYALGKRLADDRSVTAVFAANDYMALGVIRALKEAGRSVPADVSVMGYDNAPESAFFDPPLTTVSQDFPALGARAFAILAAQLGIDGKGSSQPYLPEQELIVRASTAPPP